MKLILASLLLGSVLCMSGPSFAQPKDALHGEREAYTWTIRCYMIAAIAAGDRKKAGDSEKAAYYDRRAENSFNGIKKMGALLGLNNRQMNYDIEIAQDLEMRRYLADTDYYKRGVGMCKGLELL